MKYREIKAVVLAFAMAATAALGCGNADDFTPVPASGTVTFEGKPVEFGTIQFVPERGRSAGAQIQDGRFTLTTINADDGAVPGKHQVAVISTKEVKKGKETDGTTVFLVPDMYASYGSSGITVEITSKGNSDIKIELKKPTNDPKADPSILSRRQ